MSLTGGAIARRAGDRIEIRAQPSRLRWTLPDLATADGHRLTCTFTCSIAAVDRAADRQMLAETFLAQHEVVSTDHVITHFQPALKSAATQLTSTRSADAWLNDHAEAAIADALRTAAKPIAFAAGLELLPPFEVQLVSPSVERLRAEAMERQLAERRSAGQVEHFQRAAELLRSFDALRAASPGISVGRVLESVSPSDRGAMVQTLLAASGEQNATQTLWAVGGMGLARVEVDGSVEPFDTPTEVGPPRSLQGWNFEGEPVWLIGCRSGVLMVRASDCGTIAIFRDHEVRSALGFSRVILRDGEIVASHAEAGIVYWRTDRPDEPMDTLRPAPGEQPRYLCALDAARLVYSTGRALVTLHGEERAVLASESSHEIIALLAHDRDLFVVCADGEVICKDRATLETQSRSRHCGPVCAAALLPWVAGVRLLLATRDGPVCCVGTDDSVVTQYVSAHRGIKSLAATNGLVAGISADRQRVVFWNSWDGRKPTAEVNVAARTRQRVADIAFAPPAPQKDAALSP